MIDFITNNVVEVLGGAGGLGLVVVLLKWLLGGSNMQKDSLSNITKMVNAKNSFVFVIVLLFVIIGALLYLYVNCQGSLSDQKTQVVLNANSNNTKALYKLKQLGKQVDNIDATNDTLRIIYYEAIVELVIDTTTIDTTNGEVW